jgi:DNA-binding NarL/FixJ family response regulator
LALNISDGERAVIQGLADGLERTAIAKTLGVSVSTVHNRIYEAIKRNECRTSYALVAQFVGDAYEAAARAAETSAAPE